MGQYFLGIQYVAQGRDDVAKALIEAGADLNIVSQVQSMMLILDDNSQIGAHIKRYLSYLICSKNLMRS